MSELTELDIEELKSAVEMFYIANDELKPEHFYGTLRTVFEQGKKIHESLKPKPVFPTEGGWLVDADGEVHEMGEGINYSEAAAQGRTFYTLKEAEAFAKRERAKTRVIEKIHEANGEFSAWVDGGQNYYIYLNRQTNSLLVDFTGDYQLLEPELYLSKEAADKLIKDKTFLQDYRIMLGVE